jgi:hypothetical protein
MQAQHDVVLHLLHLEDRKGHCVGEKLGQTNVHMLCNVTTSTSCEPWYLVCVFSYIHIPVSIPVHDNYCEAANITTFLHA